MILTFAFVLGSLIASVPAAALDGKAIMTRVEDVKKLPQFTAKATLTTVKAGTTKEKTFTIWRKLKTDVVHYSSLTRFHAPAEVKNEAILFLENDRGENDILLYLPAYQKTRRLERSQQSSSFMGSDFSYSDITTPHVTDFDYVLKAEEKCPNEPASDCYRVEGTPVSDSIRDRTGYAKVVSWVKKGDFLVLWSENYGTNGALLKAVALSQGEKLPSGKWFQKRIAVTTKKDGGQTTLQFSDLKTETKIEDALFTQQMLGKGSQE